MAFIGVCNPDEGQFNQAPLTVSQIAELEAWTWKGNKAAFSEEEIETAKQHLWERLEGWKM